MNKFFLLCLLGLTFISLASSTSQCDLTFYGPPPAPVCTPSGCTAVDPSASRAILSPTQTTLNMGSNTLYELDFTGTCSKCTLTLYSLARYSGGSYSYPLSQATNGVIFASKIWTVANKSWKVTCSF